MEVICISESYEDKRERITNMCTENGCMDAQKALNELCRYILGEDYYIVDPLPNIQCNPIIVLDIESKLRENRTNLKKRKIEKVIKWLQKNIGE